jgi:arabinose-5-phosphate isomerase
LSNHTTIKQAALRTLRLESEAITHLEAMVDDEFVKVVESLLHLKGRLIITGIGKSANIAQKLVATFNSTGQPAIFMHAADAIHGDLGNIQKEDMVLCISKSGDSPEIKMLLPLVKSMGNQIIGMVSNMQSFLALKSDLLLKTPITKEACPNNLAPTTSTTAQLAMGDAVAVALMECRGFSASDFARYHPGGALGKKLYLKAGDLLSANSSPFVELQTSIPEVIVVISAARLGATAVLDDSKLVGIITDGDIRRMLQNDTEFKNLVAKNIMGKTPKTIEQDALAVEAFQLMESNNITQLIVTHENKYRGIIHLHDILKEGIF